MWTGFHKVNSRKYLINLYQLSFVLISIRNLSRYLKCNLNNYIVIIIVLKNFIITFVIFKQILKQPIASNKWKFFTVFTKIWNSLHYLYLKKYC